MTLCSADSGCSFDKKQNRRKRLLSAVFAIPFKSGKLVELELETAGLSCCLVLGDDSVSSSLVELLAYSLESLGGICIKTIYLSENFVTDVY